MKLSRRRLSLSLSLSLCGSTKKVLHRVLSTLQKLFYGPEKLNGDWQAAVARHRPLVEGANTPADFEEEVSDILLSVDDQNIIPPEHPVFTMGERQA
jgi:hypothetical protein